MQVERSGGERTSSRVAQKQGSGIGATTAGNFFMKLPFTSLDHLVGAGEQGWWYAEPECSRSLGIDHQFELARLHHR